MTNTTRLWLFYLAHGAVSTVVGGSAAAAAGAAPGPAFLGGALASGVWVAATMAWAIVAKYRTGRDAVDIIDRGIRAPDELPSPSPEARRKLMESIRKPPVLDIRETDLREAAAFVRDSIYSEQAHLANELLDGMGVPKDDVLRYLMVGNMLNMARGNASVRAATEQWEAAHRKADAIENGEPK